MCLCCVLELIITACFSVYGQLLWNAQPYLARMRCELQRGAARAQIPTETMWRHWCCLALWPHPLLSRTVNTNRNRITLYASVRHCRLHVRPVSWIILACNDSWNALSYGATITFIWGSVSTQLEFKVRLQYFKYGFKEAPISKIWTLRPPIRTKKLYNQHWYHR